MTAYIGIDPGTVRAGIAVICVTDDGKQVGLIADVIKLPGNYDPAKCGVLATEVRKNIRAARLAGATRICIAIERPFCIVIGQEKNWDSYGKLCRAVGALAAGALLDNTDVVVTEIDNKHVKRAATGNENASKEQVARAVIGRFKLKVEPEKLQGEGADALSIAAFIMDRRGDSHG